MRNLVLTFAAAVFALSFSAFARADGGCCSKDGGACSNESTVADASVTLEGKLQCAHCALKEGDKCRDVLVTKQGNKEVRYDVVLTGDAKGKHVCQGTKEVKVTGTVAEKNGAKILTATKIEEIKA